MNWKLLTLLGFATATLSASAYEFIIDTDPSNGFGVIDASTTVIQGQSFQIDVYLKREGTDTRPIDAYGITVEFNNNGTVLGLDGPNPVAAYSLASSAGNSQYALDGNTVSDPFDLDPGATFSNIALPTIPTGGLVNLSNSGATLASTDQVNGFLFADNSGGGGIFSDSETPFPFTVNPDEYILLQAISFVAQNKGSSEIAAAGVFNALASNSFSTPRGAAKANTNLNANAFALFDSNTAIGGGVASRAIGANFINGSITVTAVPEPSTFSLFALCAGLWLYRKRQA